VRARCAREARHAGRTTEREDGRRAYLEMMIPGYRNAMLSEKLSGPLRQVERGLRSATRGVIGVKDWPRPGKRCSGIGGLALAGCGQHEGEASRWRRAETVTGGSDV